MSYRTHICSFDGVPDAKKAAREGGYEGFREAVLKAGRFSVFEATENNRMASLYGRLCRDPEIETDISCGFPWTKVRRRDAEPPHTPPA